MTQVRFVISDLPPNTPDGLLFLTGDHRKWGNESEGWTFERPGNGAVLDADFAEGMLLNVKVRLLHDGKTTEEGDTWVT